MTLSDATSIKEEKLFAFGMAPAVAEWPAPQNSLHLIGESIERRSTMKKSRFTEEQIIGVLKEQEAGAKAQDLCRRHGISGTTFFKWKARFGGLEPSDAKRLRTLEDENRRLKKLLAKQMLDNAALKDLGAIVKFW